MRPTQTGARFCLYRAVRVGARAHALNVRANLSSLTTVMENFKWMIFRRPHKIKGASSLAVTAGRGLQSRCDIHFAEIAESICPDSHKNVFASPTTTRRFS